MKPFYERPCAAEGLKSYRCQGRYGYIMIGADNHLDAWKEARRSTDTPHNMEIWHNGKYEPIVSY